MPDEKFVLIDKPRPQVALVTMNRPERMNAMAFDVMIPLREALEQVSHDNEVRVVVLTGAGHGFCSGADLEDSGVIPNIAGLTRATIAQRSMELGDGRDPRPTEDAPTRDRRDQRRRHRRWLLSGRGHRHPRCGRRRV